MKIGLISLVVIGAGLAFNAGYRGFQKLDDYAFINATADERGFDFRTNDRNVKRDKVEVVKGKSIYYFTEAEDDDGIDSTRLCINGSKLEFPRRDKPTKVQGVVNGCPLDSDYLRVGRNVLKYEVTDTRGNIMSDSIEVYVREE